MRVVTSGGLGLVLAMVLAQPQPVAAQQWSAVQQDVWTAVEALWQASETDAAAWDATISEAGACRTRVR